MMKYNRSRDYWRENCFEVNKILNRLDQDEKALVVSTIVRDPLKGLYFGSTFAYFTVMILFLLWPFDFSVPHKENNVRWLEDSNGLEFVGEGQILSASSTEGLCGRILMGTGLSLEVWAASQDEDQRGPARIVSYSLNPGKRNFTLGQSGKKLITRLRTSETDLNGIPGIEVDSVFGSSERQHIVVTYDFYEQSVFVNGVLRKRAKIPGGKFSNWDPSYHIVMGNEATGDRPWIGKIFYAAIYNRALSYKEIRQNYKVGVKSKGISPEISSWLSEGAVIRYFFVEKRGDRIGSDGKEGMFTDLYIPERIRSYKRDYLAFDVRKLFENPSFYSDIVFNVIFFIPIGFLLHALETNRYRSFIATFVLVLCIGILFSLIMESLQYFSLTRHSSFFDVLNNSMGIIVGIVANKVYEVYLHKQYRYLSIF